MQKEEECEMRSLDFGGHPLLHHYHFLMSQRRKEGKMEFAITLLLIILVLDIVALRWGHDSRDSLESAEWERRKRWYLLTPAHHD